MLNRPPVVAYRNSRLILMLTHEDCTEYKSRAIFDGRTWQHTALVYTEGDAWFVLLTSQVEGEEPKDRFDAEAFLTEKNARNYAFNKVATMQGQQERQ